MALSSPASPMASTRPSARTATPNGVPWLCRLRIDPSRMSHTSSRSTVRPANSLIPEEFAGRTVDLAGRTVDVAHLVEINRPPGELLGNQGERGGSRLADTQGKEAR